MKRLELMNTYNDFSTQEKRKIRQQVLSECQISNKTFYNIINGKQARKVLVDRIWTVIDRFKPLSQSLSIQRFVNSQNPE